VQTKRAAIAFAFAARTGVRMISTPSLRQTLSKSRVHVLSRSRIRNRAGIDRSGNVQACWRACRTAQAPLGFALHPARCTRRLPASMKRTYRRRSQIVSTINLLVFRRHPYGTSALGSTCKSG